MHINHTLSHFHRGGGGGGGEGSWIGLEGVGGDWMWGRGLGLDGGGVGLDGGGVG